MKLSIIPYNTYFRIIGENGITIGPVYFKPNLPPFSKTHVLFRDSSGQEKHLPRDTEVEILDKTPNF